MKPPLGRPNGGKETSEKEKGLGCYASTQIAPAVASLAPVHAHPAARRIPAHVRDAAVAMAGPCALHHRLGVEPLLASDPVPKLQQHPLAECDTVELLTDEVESGDSDHRLLDLPRSLEADAIRCAFTRAWGASGLDDVRVEVLGIGVHRNPKRAPCGHDLVVRELAQHGHPPVQRIVCEIRDLEWSILFMKTELAVRERPVDVSNRSSGY